MNSDDTLTALPPNLRGDLDWPRLPQQARSREKRRRLLDAALALFEERGYDTTTIDAVAERAGVSVGVFYSYFRSKRQILLTLSRERVEQVSFNLGGLTPDTLTIPAIEATLAQFLRDARQYAGMRRALREAALADPDVAALCAWQEQQLQAHLAAAIQQGRATGHLYPDLDPDATALAIRTLVTGLRDELASAPGEQTATALRAAASMIYRALCPAPALAPASDCDTAIPHRRPRGQKS